MSSTCSRSMPFECQNVQARDNQNGLEGWAAQISWMGMAVLAAGTGVVTRTRVCALQKPSVYWELRMYRQMLAGVHLALS